MPVETSQRPRAVMTPASCFFCEAAREQLARTERLDDRLASEDGSPSARRVRAHLERLRATLARHASDVPRGGAATPRLAAERHS